MTLTDLDLEQLDPSTGSVQAASSSAIDNVEQVRSMGAGEVIYKVKAVSSVDSLPAEPYAIAARRPLTPLATPKPTADLQLSTSGPVRPGEPVSVTARVANPSTDLTAEDVEVSLQVPHGLEVMSGAQTQSFGSVSNASGDRTATWTVRGTSDGVKQLVAEARATKYGTTFSTSDAANVTIDGSGPAMTLATPPQITTDPNLLLTWGGADPAGVRAYDIDVSTNGGPFVPWLIETSNTSATYAADFGNRYAFRARATDLLDNRSGYLVSDEVRVVEPARLEEPSPPPIAPTKASADLRITSIRRRGRRLQLHGRIAAAATGSVSGSWRARAGRRTLRARDVDRARNGRFALTLRLPRNWRTARHGSVTVRYAGDGAHLAQTARRNLRIAR